MVLKRILKILLAILLTILTAAAIYIAYVFISYYRLEDNLPLEVQGSGGESISAGEIYRMVSYNIGFGAYSPDYTFFMDGGKESRARSYEEARDNVKSAADEALSMSPDIVLFQEVDVGSTRSHSLDEYDILIDRVGKSYSRIFAQNYDSPYLFYPITCPHGASRAGIVTFSSFPITSSIRRSLPVETGFMKLLDLDRCYSVSRIPLETEKELVLYNLHLSAYSSDGTIADEQLEILFEDMMSEYEKGNYVIGGGDFNKDLLGDSGSIFGVSGENYTWAQPIPEGITPVGLSVITPYDVEDPVPSCRNPDIPYSEDSFVVTVDGFIISDNVELIYTNVRDAGFKWSDHNPVYMDFMLK